MNLIKTLPLVVIFAVMSFFIADFLKTAQHETADRNPVTRKARNLMSPVEVVQDYIVRSGTCGVMSVDDLTSLASDDYIAYRHGGDQTYLEESVTTPDKIIRYADVERDILYKWITFELPELFCKRKAVFGRVSEEKTTSDKSEVTVDFIIPDGTYGFSWRFKLEKQESGWSIYILEFPRKEGEKPIYELVRPRTDFSKYKKVQREGQEKPKVTFKARN